MIASQTWWHLARTAGLVAWALICASVIWGLLLSTRVLGRRPTRPWLLAMHRYLSALAIAATAVHVVALRADSYIQFRIVDVLVPMASPWRSCEEAVKAATAAGRTVDRRDQAGVSLLRRCS